MKKCLGIIKTAFLKLLKDIWQGKYVIIILFAWTRLTKWILGAMCPVVIATGLPCPGCGMTRAAGSVLALDFYKAFMFNPCVFIWGAYVLYLGIYRYLLNKKIPRFVFVTTAVCLVTIAVYIFRMVHSFPSTAPMTYMYDNMFSRMIPGYRKFIASIWDI